MHKITAVLTHHLNKNQKYLSACLQSLILQEGVDLEIIVMASTLEEPQVPDDPRIKVVRIPHTTYTTAAYSQGYEMARLDSKYFMCLNDDLILAKNACRVMAETCGDNQVILNSFSNDGLGSLFLAYPYFKDKQGKTLEITHQMSFEQVEPYIEAIQDFPEGANIVIKTQTNCFFATMIPRSVYERVGGLDVEGCGKYYSSHEDTDFCFRAAKLGIPCLLTFRTFIWHFGGVTVQYTMSNQDRKKGRKAFCQKWGIPYDENAV